MLWKQTLTQFCNEIKGGFFFCSRHQTLLLARDAELSLHCFLPQIHFHRGLKSELFFLFMFYL